MKFPHPTTIAVIVIGALATIWLANNVTAIGKLVAKRQATS